MLARVSTFALVGVDAVEVAVEADIHPGLPAFTIVGLPDAAVQESRERVRAALVNCGFEFPLRRITVNLAPADLRKAGPGFDLALAAAVLAASGQVPAAALAGRAVCGELGLDGSVRAVRGALSAAGAAYAGGYTGLILPLANAPEASLVEGVEVAGVEGLGQLAGLLDGSWQPQPVALDARSLLARETDDGVDFAEVRGHHSLRRALEIAAAGGHNVLMYGPPGSGKSMMASRLPTILPPPALAEALEVTRVHSAAGLLGARPLVPRRPFRAPHHSLSRAGLVGGGTPPQPGEASLAHNGVLFLDELAEFQRPALEALRQPLEQQSVTLTRAQRTVSFPARFMLVAATNPCPCGFRGDGGRRCRCHPAAIQRYLARLSGPLIDRIDVLLQVARPCRAELMSERPGEPSAAIRQRVIAARARQRERLAGTPAHANAQMSAAQVRRHCRLRGPARAALARAHDRVALTVRGHDRVLRVARTIADLEGRERIERADVTEAVSYRERHPADVHALEGAA